MRERVERWVRACRARLAAGSRDLGHLPLAVAGAVAALAVLTTFTTPATPTTSTAAAADTSASPPPGDHPTRWTPREASDVPELSALLDVELLAGSDRRGTEVDTGRLVDDEDRELAAFRRSPQEPLSDDEVIPADLVVHVPGGRVDLDELAEPLAGARHTAPAARLTATTPVGDDHRELHVLGVDGATFRPLTPEVTAGADGVWERFAEGDILVTHELAEELGLELGGELELVVGDHEVPVRVGAFAANGAPAFADVLVPVPLAAELGAAGPNTLIVAAGSGDPQALGDAIASATGGELELRREPAPPVAERRTTEATPSGRIEPFTYTSRADGRIDIHGDWIGRNIVRVQLPGMATTSCHRVMVPQLLAAVEELIERDLYSHLDPSQFAGCFVARHIDWDPSKPLSMHAWGLAIDFNTRDNWLGATPKMDLRVVEVFERWGFDWGGWWSRPDGMHFELARIVPTG